MLRVVVAALQWLPGVINDLSQDDPQPSVCGSYHTCLCQLCLLCSPSQLVFRPLQSCDSLSCFPWMSASAGEPSWALMIALLRACFHSQTPASQPPLTGCPWCGQLEVAMSKGVSALTPALCLEGGGCTGAFSIAPA